MTWTPESELPLALTANDAVDVSYSPELANTTTDLEQTLSVLIECDKEVVQFAYINLRNRLRQNGIRCQYLNGMPNSEDGNGKYAGSINTMLNQLRDAVRGTSNLDRRVVVLPHIDLLTTSQGGLTAEAREVIPLLYENPDLVWLGFKDPSFTIPNVIEKLFPRRYQLLGIPSPESLAKLVTQRESRKFGEGGLQLETLYDVVSGWNPVRLRKLLSAIHTEDYPVNPKWAYDYLRRSFSPEFGYTRGGIR